MTVEAQDEQGGRTTVAVTINVIDDDSEAPETPGKPTVTAQTLNSLWPSVGRRPANAGPAINDYDVQYSEDGGAFADRPHNGPRTTATITGLKARHRPTEVQVLARSATKAKAPGPSPPTLRTSRQPGADVQRGREHHALLCREHDRRPQRRQPGNRERHRRRHA